MQIIKRQKIKLILIYLKFKSKGYQGSTICLKIQKTCFCYQSEIAKYLMREKYFIILNKKHHIDTVQRYIQLLQMNFKKQNQKINIDSSRIR
ncbi:unnamed protein product [Paramecium sonneborni]|uniref:Uncharacterized protein n=1 Tax=Paramecium sonneborni TaxID=65129 RepID=A0A8S1PDW7_9CILI|nr:unnamed protein product [Paramecium sonneborni]